MKTNSLQTSEQSTATKPAHTPTPWYLKHEHPAIVAERARGSDVFPIPPEGYHWGIVRVATPCGDFVITGENDTPARRKANAALIVRAVNSHAELVSALTQLEWAHSQLLGDRGSVEGILSPERLEDVIESGEIARAALAKAKA